ncbi:MAG TPA: hypothetical protein VGN37_28400 [Actinocatenispora sp.]
MSALIAGVAGVGGAVAFATAPATAGSTPAATINYSGNCGVAGLLSQSKPDTDQPVSVPEGSSVVFVNKMSVKATLVIGQDTYKDIAPGSTKSVVMDQGTVHPKMQPQCGLLGDTAGYKAATVTVTPKSDPTGGSSSGGGTSSGGSGTSGTGSTSGHQGSGTGNSASSGADHKAPVPGHQPNGGAAPKVHEPVARGAVPSGAAAPGAGSGTSGGGGEISGTSLPEPPQPVAAKPVSDSGPSSATSVLALIAAVCLVGVGAAAVRTVLAQRHQGSAA